MSVIGFLIATAFIGIIVGGLARLALPGRDPLSLVETMLVGIAGSLAAGIVGWLVFGREVFSLLLSVVFASVIVYFIRRSRGGSLTDPGHAPEVDRR